MTNFQKSQALKILSNYIDLTDIGDESLRLRNDSEALLKAHFELEQYHRYGKVLFRKRSKKDNSLVYHSSISANTKDFTKIKEVKQKISENGYKNEEVEKLVNAVLSDDFVNKLKKMVDNKNSVFIPMPSSTGKNTIPKMFAEKLGRKLGVEVLENDFTFSTKQDLQAKKLRGVDKLIHQKQYGIDFSKEKQLEKYKDKKVYIVDDLFTTGQSTNNYAKMLNDNGFQVYDLITMTSASTSFTSQTDINKMIELAIDNLGIDRETATKKLNELSEYSSTIGRQFYQDLTAKTEKTKQKYKDWFYGR